MNKGTGFFLQRMLASEAHSGRYGRESVFPLEGTGHAGACPAQSVPV